MSALSNDNIQSKVNCKFILYQDMYRINNISELLPKCLILYQLATIGHFCCVFINSEGINFFDPLGYFPDDELKLVSGGAPKHDFTYLNKLLWNTDIPIIYNDYKFQSKNTSTCGHWCCIRMIYSKLTNDEFISCFKNIAEKDDLIVKLYDSI